jgi:hypothetical protein
METIFTVNLEHRLNLTFLQKTPLKPHFSARKLNHVIGQTGNIKC